MKNLLGTLQDPGANFVAGQLDYQLSGSLDKVQQILFQKQDGSFYLALWIETTNYNYESYAGPLGQTAVAAQSVTLKTTASQASAQIFDDNGNLISNPLTATSGGWNFQISDHVTLVKIVR